MTRILVVEDEPDIALGLEQDLRLDGYDVEVLGDGQSAVEYAQASIFDLILLDVNLPRKDGFTVCRELRRAGCHTPIIVLTARDHEAEKIQGLELGADDYVTKPFNPRALVARVKAILRRTEVTVRGGRPVEVGSLRIDPRRREATVADRRVELRAREFDLLLALARDAGVVLTRDALLSGVWGTDFPGETRTVDVHVAELRRKLGPEAPAIDTVRGMGYRLVPPGREPIAAVEAGEGSA